MKNFKILLASLMILSFTTGLQADTTSMTFLDIIPDARSEGRAESFVAVADDAAGMNYWNPGRLGFLNKSVGASFTHAQYFADITYNYLAAYVGLGKYMNFGLSGIMMGSEILNSTLWDGTDIIDAPSDDSASELAIGVTWGAQVIENIGVGVGVKFANETLDSSRGSATGTALAFDVGVLACGLVENLNLGLNLKDLGGSVNYGGDDNPMPMKVLVGAAYDVWKSKNVSGPFAGKGKGLIDENGNVQKSKNAGGPFVPQKINVSLDSHLDLAGETRTFVNIGAEAEALVIQMITVRLRAGYKIVTDTGALSGLATGIGFVFNNIGVDYAYSSKGDLGAMIHRITLSYQMDLGSSSGMQDIQEQVEEDAGSVEEQTQKALEDAMQSDDSGDVQIDEGSDAIDGLDN